MCFKGCQTKKVIIVLFLFLYLFLFLFLFFFLISDLLKSSTSEYDSFQGGWGIPMVKYADFLLQPARSFSFRIPVVLEMVPL